MSLAQRVNDLAVRIASEVKAKPSKSADATITGHWNLAQMGIEIVSGLTTPTTGYVKFAAKTDGLYQKIGLATEVRLLTTADSYQPLDADLTSIGALAGTTGFLKKTAANTWSLDTVTYQPLHANLTGIAGLPVMPGIVKTDGAGNWSLDASPYVVGTPWRGEGYIEDADFASNGLMTRTGAGTYTITPTSTYSLSTHNHSGVYQPLSSDLTTIAGLGPTMNVGMAGLVIMWQGTGWGYGSPWTSAGYISLTSLSSTATGLTYNNTTGVFSFASTYFIPTTTTLSGTNTGDETTSTIKSKLGITTLSGSNTGDNAVNSLYSSLVSNATHTGDATGATALTLATVNSNIGTFNNVTVNAKGLVTAANNASYAALAGSSTQAFSTANLSVTGTIVATSTVKGTYGIFTGLADNRVPYHVNDTTGFWDSGISADGTNMSINSGKIKTKTLTDPTHFLWNNSYDYESINVSVGFMIENYNNNVNPNYTGGISTWASFTVTAAGAVWTNGNISAQEVYRRSSRELKYDIQDFTFNAMTILRKTKIVSYRMKSDYSFAIGFIAEDTHHWLSGDDQKSHIFGNHLALLTKGLQEEDEKIARLQHQVHELQNQIKQIQDGRGF